MAKLRKFAPLRGGFIAPRPRTIGTTNQIPHRIPTDVFHGPKVRTNTGGISNKGVWSNKRTENELNKELDKVLQNQPKQDNKMSDRVLDPRVMKAVRVAVAAAKVGQTAQQIYEKLKAMKSSDGGGRSSGPLYSRMIVSTGPITNSFTQVGKYQKPSAFKMTKNALTIREGQNESSRVDGVSYGRQVSKCYSFPNRTILNDALLEAQAIMGENLEPEAPVLPFRSQIRVTLKNADESPCVLTIYDIVPRIDMGSAVSDTKNYPDPLQAWLPIGTDEFGAEYSIDELDTTPSNLKNFNRQFKIKKVRKVQLLPGATHVHTAVYYYRRKYPLTAGLVSSITGSPAVANFAGVGGHVLIVAKGTPVGSTLATEINNVSTSKVHLMTISQMKLSVLFDKITKKSYQIFPNSTTFLDTITAANESSMSFAQGKQDTVGDNPA